MSFAWTEHPQNNSIIWEKGDSNHKSKIGLFKAVLSVGRNLDWSLYSNELFHALLFHSLKNLHYKKVFRLAWIVLKLTSGKTMTKLFDQIPKCQCKIANIFHWWDLEESHW